MNELLQYLDQFQPVLHHAQYAVDGNWEEAVTIDLNNPIPSLSEVPDDATIAVEAFYKLNDQRVIFLGVRYTDDLAATQSPAQFLNRACSALRQAKNQSPRELLETLGTVFNDDPRTYTAQPIQYVELGVEGYWKSEGSVVLRQAGEPILNDMKLEEKLQQHPQLMKNSKNPIALEFAFTAPTGWLGVQVSEQRRGEFVTDIKSLSTLVDLI